MVLLYVLFVCTVYVKQYIEQHNPLIWKSAGRAPSLRGIPWHLPYN